MDEQRKAAIGNPAPCGGIFSEIEFLTMFRLVLWRRKLRSAFEFRVKRIQLE